MARKKDPEVFVKWSACTAKKVGVISGSHHAEILFNGKRFDMVSTERGDGTLKSLCLAYMKDISPSKSALESRFNVFTRRLKEQYGIEPNDVDPREDIDFQIALAMAEEGWSMIAGIDALLREIGEDRELERVDRKRAW